MMASTVTRMAREKASRPSVASSPARWGSRVVWIDWKSCNGARAIMNALNTTPASRLPAEAATVSTATFRSVCSASWTSATEAAKSAPSRIDRSLPVAGGVERSGRPRGGDDAAVRRARRAGTRTGRRGCRARLRSARSALRSRRRWGRGSARSTRTARARRTARTTGVRRSSPARSSWPRTPAPRRRRSKTARRIPRRSSSGPRNASATTRKISANDAWMVSGTRSGCSPSASTARRVAIVRESSCSTGR